MKKYINEEELLDNIGILYEYHKEQMNFVAYSTIEDVCQIIDDMPSEDVVEVRHGEWIDTGDEELDKIYSGYKCSVCGFIICGHSGKYCSECGAKMDGERKEL